jgi:hypothetical protein
VARVCREYKKWVEERIERPVDEWVERTEERCKRRKWYDPRRWVCWLVTTLVKVVRWVVVTAGKWVTYSLCEVVTGVLNVAAALIGMILSIPIIGRLVALIWRGLLDLVWRIVGVLDFVASLLGLLLPKKLRVCIIILSDSTRTPMATPESLQPAIESATQIYKDTFTRCSIRPQRRRSNRTAEQERSGTISGCLEPTTRTRPTPAASTVPSSASSATRPLWSSSSCAP